jgi:hypothetical protein
MPAPLFRPLPRIFLRTFGEREPALYSEAGGEPREIAAIFNSAYAQTDAVGVQIEDTRPTAWVATVDAPNAGDSDEDRITVGGKTWRIVACKRDGKGMSELQLGNV